MSASACDGCGVQGAELASVGSDLRSQRHLCVRCEAKLTHTCHVCRKPILPSVTSESGTNNSVRFENRFWHVECLQCENCGKAVHRNKHFKHNGRLVCKKCKMNTFIDNCVSCHQYIGGPFVKRVDQDGRSWHGPCYKCDECGATPGKPTHIQRPGGGLVCWDCDSVRLQPVCVACQKKVAGTNVGWRGRHWHPACFVCTECSVPVTSQVHAQDGRPCCAACYGARHAPRCTACKKLLQGGDKIQRVEGSMWHSTCFMCTRCGARAVHQGFRVTDRVIVCAFCVRNAQIVAKPDQGSVTTYL